MEKGNRVGGLGYRRRYRRTLEPIFWIASLPETDHPGRQMLLRKKIVVGSLQCNCTVLVCDRTKEAVVIDPGDEADRILTQLKNDGATVKYLLHTHAHFDHVGATAALKQALAPQICLHRGDEKLYTNLPLQGQFFGMTFDEPPPVDRFIEDDEPIVFGDYGLRVIHTPGHSPGSVCFQLQQDLNEVYSGDTLFARSVGRADLWGGDGAQLIRSIRERLLVLEDEIAVHPGHGPSTTIGVERRENPFLIR